MKLNVLTDKILSALCFLALSIDAIRDLYFYICYREQFFAKVLCTFSSCFYLVSAVYLVLDLFGVKNVRSYMWMYFFAFGLVLDALDYFIAIVSSY